MNELIKVNEVEQTVSARTLYEAVGSTERFSAWFERQLQFGFVENEDYVGCKFFNTQANQELQDYILSIDMAKHICMVQKSEKAKQVRQYLIDLEKAWNTPEQIMARALRVADQTIASLNQKVLEMKPKADFFDAVTDSKQAIEMGQVAKVLDMGIGRNKLFEFLRAEKILMGNNQPYQRYIDEGYFRVVEQKFTKENGETMINIKTLVFQKGVNFIRKRLQKETLNEY